MHNRYGLGSNGFCVCPKCNHKTDHKRGVPCQEEKCPQCGAKMLREDSYHHDLLQKKKDKKTK